VWEALSHKKGISDTTSNMRGEIGDSIPLNRVNCPAFSEYLDVISNGYMLPSFTL